MDDDIMKDKIARNIVYFEIILTGGSETRNMDNILVPEGGLKGYNER
jgi:hypothetical protein